MRLLSAKEYELPNQEDSYLKPEAVSAISKASGFKKSEIYTFFKLNETEEARKFNKNRMDIVSVSLFENAMSTFCSISGKKQPESVTTMPIPKFS